MIKQLVKVRKFEVILYNLNNYYINATLGTLARILIAGKITLRALPLMRVGGIRPLLAIAGGKDMPARAVK